MTKYEIAEKLKVARINAGMTQKDVSLATGRSAKLVGHWETGYSQPDADTLACLLKLYGLDANTFFEIKQAPADKPGPQDEISEDEAIIIKCFRRFSPYEQAAILHFATRFVLGANQQPVEITEAEREKIAEDMARDVEKYVAESRRSQLLRQEAAE